MVDKHIVLICDDNYCLPTGVCIQSIIDSNLSASSYLIHVCSFGLAESNKSWLEHLSCDSVKVKVEVFDEELFEARINKISQRSHVTPTALIKFELANFFSELDSILYLDSDIVVKGDLLKLFETDITNSYLAASYEFWKYIEKISYSFSRKVGDLSFYNSGVMYMNLKKFREDNISEKLWDYKINKAKTTLMDQESLIAVCGQKLEMLSILWNFNPSFLNPLYIKGINRVYQTSYNNCQNLLNDVRIIHYVGSNDKPWLYKNARLREYWDVAYNVIKGEHQLDLKEYSVQHRSKWISIREKIKKYGIGGFICNMCYCINCKLKV